MTARAAILFLSLALLTPALGWLVFGYRQYQVVERFDDNQGNCVVCPAVGRPRAPWPYSMFTGTDPRYDRAE